ncbi:MULTISPECIES: hypothetical protein [unclassified Streptomyces]|uniref:hypothetical protein n=1 Tax=unclassified Streptomyces TaxID=2593676 RepID=UPI003797F45A
MVDLFPPDSRRSRTRLNNRELGEEGVAWAAARPGCEVFAVDAGRRVVRTGGVPTAGAG